MNEYNAAEDNRQTLGEIIAKLEAENPGVDIMNLYVGVENHEYDHLDFVGAAGSCLYMDYEECDDPNEDPYLLQPCLIFVPN